MNTDCSMKLPSKKLQVYGESIRYNRDVRVRMGQPNKFRVEIIALDGSIQNLQL